MDSVNKISRYFYLLSLFVFLMPSATWGGILYDQHSHKVSFEFGKTFSATGQVQVTSSTRSGAGTGTLIVIDGRPAVLTAAHVIEGKGHVGMALDTPTGELTLPLSQNSKHIYPLYTQLKDKCFDVGIIFLEEGSYTFEEDKLKIHRLFQEPVFVHYMTVSPLAHEEAATCLTSFAGYGTPGTFNGRGHVFYEEERPQKIGSQMTLTPKKNILYEHGCGYETHLDITSDEVKKISQTHFFWDRVQKSNNPR